MFYFHLSVITQTEAGNKKNEDNNNIQCVCVCVCDTHVESGSLSRLPRPGILKAFARLFFPPSGGRALMYSSKPTRAAGDMQFDKIKKINNTQIWARSWTVHSLRCVTLFSVWVYSYFYCYVRGRFKSLVYFTQTGSKKTSCRCAVPGRSLPVPFDSANFWMRLSMPMFSTFCLNSSWTCSRAEWSFGPSEGLLCWTKWHQNDCFCYQSFVR